MKHEKEGKMEHMMKKKGSEKMHEGGKKKPSGKMEMRFGKK
jgi:hypothetical protein